MSLRCGKTDFKRLAHWNLVLYSYYDLNTVDDILKKEHESCPLDAEVPSHSSSFESRLWVTMAINVSNTGRNTMATLDHFTSRHLHQIISRGNCRFLCLTVKLVGIILKLLPPLRQHQEPSVCCRDYSFCLVSCSPRIHQALSWQMRGTHPKSVNYLNYHFMSLSIWNP